MADSSITNLHTYSLKSTVFGGSNGRAPAWSAKSLVRSLQKWYELIGIHYYYTRDLTGENVIIGTVLYTGNRCGLACANKLRYTTTHLQQSSTYMHIPSHIVISGKLIFFFFQVYLDRFMLVQNL